MSENPEVEVDGASAAVPPSQTDIAGSEPATAVPVAAKKPVVTYFNAVVHEAVQQLHNKGVWYDMGPRYGDLLWRLRPFHHPSVIKVAEAVEKNVRLKNKYDEKEDISGEHRMEINRAAIIMATTGVSGFVNVGTANLQTEDPDLVELVEGTKKAFAAARRYKYAIDEREDGLVLISFVGTETERQLRDVVEPLLASSVSMLNQLYKASSNLQKVKDEEIFALGEKYVYGRTVGQNWAD